MDDPCFFETGLNICRMLEHVDWNSIDSKSALN